ncbi:MAG: ERCC4 domain-containing protein [Lapillicoccus sp.]
MSMEFLVARNPDPASSLPFLIRVPWGPEGLVLKAKQPWPRTSKVYCHRADGWPPDVEVLERVPVRVCSRRGPAIDLILDRSRENRSQLVVTQARGREVIFWQSPRTAKQARPNVALPTRRAAGQVLEVVVDTGEKYPYAFTHQQASTVRRRLPAGDYAVDLNGAVVAAVERKSLSDLASSLLSGRLTTRWPSSPSCTGPHWSWRTATAWSSSSSTPRAARWPRRWPRRRRGSPASR